MGQTVVIRDSVTMEDVLLISTDRSFTGQDGQAITPDSPGQAVPGLLAEKLFDLDLGIDHVYVLQNMISVRRPGGWDSETVAQTLDVTSSFLRHYPDVDEEE
ncbi:MAG: hypothetical protein WD895_06920 [Acidimicrobiia bacterium]